jgi:hypothetical protein
MGSRDREKTTQARMNRIKEALQIPDGPVLADEMDEMIIALAGVFAPLFWARFGEGFPTTAQSASMADAMFSALHRQLAIVGGTLSDEPAADAVDLVARASTDVITMVVDGQLTSQAFEQRINECLQRTEEINTCYQAAAANGVSKGEVNKALDRAQGVMLAVLESIKAAEREMARNKDVERN